MNIGIVGLGLIGGSFAKAYKNAGAMVLGTDKDQSITDFAKLAGSIDEELDEAHFRLCDCIILAITPSEAIKWLECHAPEIEAGTTVVDCCGTKRHICEKGYALAKTYGFTFVGGHPMAGKQIGGFKNSRADLFKNTCMALVPEKCDDIILLGKMKRLFILAGFAKIAVMSAQEHDERIAFTSQLAHLVSNAFIKGDTVMKDSKAASVTGGSFRDFTRVAYLDEDMWTELFIENKDNLKRELSTLIEELYRYEKALETENEGELKSLLRQGRECKSEVERICG